MSAASKADESVRQPKARAASVSLGRLFVPFAALSVVLGPVVGMLISEGGLYHIITAVLVFLVAAGLWGYCGHLIYENFHLASELATLKARLKAAEKAQPVVPAKPRPEPGARANAAFVAGISQELRTPLSALLGMAQLLDRSDLIGPQKNHVKVMLEAGRGLQTLLDDLIALTHEAVEGECEPGQAARAVVQLMQPLAWEKRLRLTVTAAPNMPRVALDAPRVRQVLLKLVENGLKFTENGEVAVRIDGQDGFVRFAVADTGPGVSPDIGARLFSHPAVNAALARKQPGMGLGLAVVKHIVERAGGKVGFDSQPGRGSNFWFTLPVAASSVAALKDAGNAPSGLRLLVVTDDETLAQPLTLILEPRGNDVEIARSVADAASRAGRARYDAILTRAEDADTLAAAPGVRAPLLALVTRTERKPLCADEVLIWPAEPGQLYDALSRICTPGAAENDLAIDKAAFTALEKSVGTAALMDMLRSYIGTAELLCAGLENASHDGRWDEAARLARDIAGASAGLGLAAITAAARNFVAEAGHGNNPHALRNGAQMIVSEHERVRYSLEELYPDLVA